MPQKLDRHLETAIAAVRVASTVCQAVQRKLVSADTLQKKDRSPVTVADFASQAVVCAKLGEAFPDDPVVGEEAADELRREDQGAIRAAVVEQVRAVMGSDVAESRVLDWIDRGGAEGSTKRFWTIDPIDGTKGFLRREQYAVALALIEDGQVVLGVLGCPDLSIGEGRTGAVLAASRGAGAIIAPLSGAGMNEFKPVHVSDITDPSHARFCESVDAGHTDVASAEKIAHRLGITGEPVRIDSQVKYAVVARGEASIYLRLPTRKDYVEKIWDHAAGMIVVEEAGGRVTDVDGKPLDYTHGRGLSANRGIVGTNGPIHDAVVAAVRAVLGGG